VTYSDTSSVELLLVHLLDGGISLGLLTVGLWSVVATTEAVCTHDETETPGSASLLVLHDDTLILSAVVSTAEKRTHVNDLTVLGESLLMRTCRARDEDEIGSAFQIFQTTR
jgi:hypothetical protein